jgi:hypothetical protein
VPQPALRERGHGAAALRAGVKGNPGFIRIPLPGGNFPTPALVILRKPGDQAQAVWL